MIRLTFSSVFLETRPLLWRTRSTVPMETPALAAISLMVVIFYLLIFVNVNVKIYPFYGELSAKKITFEIQNSKSKNPPGVIDVLPEVNIKSNDDGQDDPCMEYIPTIPTRPGFRLLFGS